MTVIPNQRKQVSVIPDQSLSIESISNKKRWANNQRLTMSPIACKKEILINIKEE